MSKLYLLIGPPASGKSTWCKEKCKDIGIVRLCRDDIRKMLKCTYIFGQSYIEDLCTKIVYWSYKHCFESGMDVILDQTNCNLKYLKQLLLTIPKDVQIEYVFFEIPYWKQRYRCIVRWLLGGIWIPINVSLRMNEGYKQVKQFVYESSGNKHCIIS